MAKKNDYTIRRGNRMERTVVGIDGQTHVMNTDKEGKDGHFTDESRYRPAIDQAVAEKKQ